MELRRRRRTAVDSASNGNDNGDEPGDRSDSEHHLSSDDQLYIGSLESESEFDQGEDEKVSRKRRRKMSPETVMKEEEEEELNVVPAELEKVKPKGRKKKTKPVLMWETWEKENNKWLDENMTRDFDLDTNNEAMIESLEAPSIMVGDLLRYQKEWLAWALKQESCEAISGGILADEMGMGKTLQAIALVLSKRELGEASSSTRLRATLVICPMVAVTQWVSEIDKFTSKGTTKVLVYHGVNREKSSKKFSEYDFVITTYSIVETEFRKHMMPPKEKCLYCGKPYYEKAMKTHLKYMCGPDARRTEKQSKQTRKKYSRDNTASLFKKEGDISLPSSSKHSAAGDLHRRNSPLHAVKWERIILDEAHYIKDRQSNTAKAILALESSYKWALSGTPIQNRVGELYSLIRYLQIVPYSFYFCKDCDCRKLDHSMGECSNCHHSSVRHFCWWNKFIATPIIDHGHLNVGIRSMIFLKHKILKSILLRRTKKGRAADLALPPRIVSLRRDMLDASEHDYYDGLYSDSQAQFNTYVQAGTLLNNYAHIFDLLTRLRQAVDHPYLVVCSATVCMRNANLVNNAEAELVCGICHDQPEDHVVTSCEHVFCKACLLDYASSLEQLSCPSCSKMVTVDLTSKVKASKSSVKGFRSSSILNRFKLDDFRTSTKIEALREEIRCMVERDGSAKGIVFSQFTSFLDLINYSLQKSGIKCVQLVGSMTMNARDCAINQFTEDPDCKIFLMSLKAGGVALNLTVASHVFLMDPWWNPAVERQAQDRIHRIGQYKPIRITRFIIENTVEERILRLQEKKELVFEGTVGGSKEALGKLTEQDLRFLFVT